MNWAFFRTRRWVITTLLVILAIVVMIRLGFWQLDRLAQRRAFNARVTAQMDSPQLDLNQSLPLEALTGMEYRSVVVHGHYDFSQQVALRNQVWENQPGYDLLTPLLIDGSNDAVVVDRGWIPFDQVDHLAQYDQPGQVSVQGVIRLPQTRPFFGGIQEPTLAPGQTRREAVNLINVELLQGQVSEPLLPVYLHANPDPTWTQMPYRKQFNLVLSEGPHLNYAIQWFTFSGLLTLAYPFLAYRQMRKQIDSRQINQKNGMIAGR